MFQLPAVFVVIAWIALIPGLCVALWLAVLTLAALVPRSSRSASRPSERIAVVIPAHNESLLIAGTVAHALKQDYPRDQFTILVIADNCADDTATLAEKAGARVYERHGDPGKGQALAEVFDVLMREDWDAVLVMDADTQMQGNVLREVSQALETGSGALQVYYGVMDPQESRRTMAMELALASFNGLRPRGKAALGLSAGIFGNGFCLSRATLEKVPYTAGSIVEDLEYHLALVAAGIKVEFIDRVRVIAQMPVTAEDSQSQRVRWEQGRMTMIRNFVPSLVMGLFRGRKGSLEALIDVCTPPVSVICLCLGAAFVLGDMLAAGCALSGLILLIGHYTVAAARYGSLVRMLRVMAFVPYYFIWKTMVVGKALLKRTGAGWVRTKRH